MDQEYQKEIEEIIGAMQCPKDFQCCKPGVDTLCKAEDIGLKSYLVCWEEDIGDCKFSFPFGDGCFCKCPLRIYIARKPEKCALPPGTSPASRENPYSIVKEHG
jgi:hypothetical protein